MCDGAILKVEGKWCIKLEEQTMRGLALREMLSVIIVIITIMAFQGLPQVCGSQV